MQIVYQIGKDHFTYAKNCDENAVYNQFSDGSPHIDLLVHVDGSHLPGAPHSANKMRELVPASLRRFSALLQQRELIIARLTSWGCWGCLRLSPRLGTGRSTAGNSSSH